MPSIVLNKKVFEELIGKKLPLEELQDRISMLGTDLDRVEGNEIHVEVFPNRPDMLSEQGFARAFSAFIGSKTGLREYKLKDSKEKVIIDKSVIDVRPFTACAIVKNINFNDEKIREIIQIQEKLHITYCRNRKKAAIGVYPMEKIKCPITFFAEDPKKVKFQPLECDKEMTGLQILSQHPTGRDYAHLLEEQKKFPFFKDANGQILSMPPVINSHVTGKITEKTKEVFIECSGFDFNTQLVCLNIIVTALADMGGEICSMELEYPDTKKVTPDLSPRKIKFDLDYCNKLLGLDLRMHEAAKLFERMGLSLEKDDVLIPRYRADILHQMDLVEDVAIAYGYENFEHQIPKVATIGEIAPIEQFKSKISRILVGLGMLETNTYHLISKDAHNVRMNNEMDVIELENPVNVEYDILRGWMIPSMLGVLKDNKHNEYPQNIFEIGTIFKHSTKTETLVEENERLGVCLCSKNVTFTKIKQVFDCLMNAINLEYEIKEVEHGSFISGRTARVSVKGKDVAYIGEIHPQVLENWDLDVPCAAFELNVTEIFKFF
ncbi:phenylalanine--tRNA ligase subunit beta [Candidatus Woesearchaeota archaeon]|jgi:phenylalanyl-tRNA synthetase beta chain|nr:phenylalanine--tRNA ligase subunit beta [Candidatus Woesearchaeota archaeon]MBT3537282.1 phenylalanine--tRNA ligase subunit beta [Candidatus Woesearchaeota archaeon]MBT4696769.1 phenylalanine--tRNA ligase subunit beta [Candidatus Woesearchaeota archaeon]MBT4716752.1 phenylalanine--tRNA ligase subunit beta [Candidatus Woesearchaeota archaeon]MBT7106408.1 phenylalanine--tRNA ligase subunit beta [Candidatus Woesearchaeota archaeon]